MCSGRIALSGHTFLMALALLMDEKIKVGTKSSLLYFFVVTYFRLYGRLFLRECIEVGVIWHFFES